MEQDRQVAIETLVKETVNEEKLAELVDYCRNLEEEIQRLGASKEIARSAILKKLGEMKLDDFRTNHCHATIVIRQGKPSSWIEVEEARALLVPGDFAKLLHEEPAGKPRAVLTINLLKKGEKDGS